MLASINHSPGETGEICGVILPVKNETPEIVSEEEFLSRNGASRSGFGEPALHRLPGESPGNANRERNLNRQKLKDRELANLRETLRSTFEEKVSLGEIRLPTRIERLTSTASGHDDLESVQAARRILAKMGLWPLAPSGKQHEQV